MAPDWQNWKLSANQLLGRTETTCVSTEVIDKFMKLNHKPLELETPVPLYSVIQHHHEFYTFNGELAYYALNLLHLQCEKTFSLEDINPPFVRTGRSLSDISFVCKNITTLEAPGRKVKKNSPRNYSTGAISSAVNFKRTTMMKCTMTRSCYCGGPGDSPTADYLWGAPARPTPTLNPPLFQPPIPAATSFMHVIYGNPDPYTPLCPPEHATPVQMHAKQDEGEMRSQRKSADSDIVRHESHMRKSVAEYLTNTEVKPYAKYGVEGSRWPRRTILRRRVIDGKTARQFSAWFVEAMGELMRMTRSPLALPRFQTSGEQNSFNQAANLIFPPGAEWQENRRLRGCAVRQRRGGACHVEWRQEECLADKLEWDGRERENDGVVAVWGEGGGRCLAKNSAEGMVKDDEIGLRDERVGKENVRKDGVPEGCLQGDLVAVSKRTQKLAYNNKNLSGAAVVEQLACSPPTLANRVQCPVGSPDSRKWESCRTMPMVDGFSRKWESCRTMPLVDGFSRKWELCRTMRWSRVSRKWDVPDDACRRVFSQVGIVPDDAAGRRVSSLIFRFPALTFRHCSILTSIALIGSQDFAVLRTFARRFSSVSNRQHATEKSNQGFHANGRGNERKYTHPRELGMENRSGLDLPPICNDLARASAAYKTTLEEMVTSHSPCGGCLDLIAAESKYHKDCHLKLDSCIKMFPNENSVRGRPKDSTKMVAFQKLCFFLEESELEEYLESAYIPGGNTVINFKGTADSILYETWYRVLKRSDVDERQCVVEKTAEIIRNDILTTVQRNLRYEWIRPQTPTIFDDQYVRKTDKSAFATLFTYVLPEENMAVGTSTFVINGGYILHAATTWPRLANYYQSWSIYGKHITKNYSSAVVVFDGYSEKPGTNVVGEQTMATKVKNRPNRNVKILHPSTSKTSANLRDIAIIQNNIGDMQIAVLFVHDFTRRVPAYSTHCPIERPTLTLQCEWRALLPDDSSFATLRKDNLTGIRARRNKDSVNGRNWKERVIAHYIAQYYETVNTREGLAKLKLRLLVEIAYAAKKKTHCTPLVLTPLEEFLATPLPGLENATGASPGLSVEWIAGMKGRRETGDPREDPTTSGIVHHDSRSRKSGDGPARNRTRHALGWEASASSHSRRLRRVRCDDLRKEHTLDVTHIRNTIPEHSGMTKDGLFKALRFNIHTSDRPTYRNIQGVTAEIPINTRSTKRVLHGSSQTLALSGDGTLHTHDSVALIAPEPLKPQTRKTAPRPGLENANLGPCELPLEDLSRTIGRRGGIFFRDTPHPLQEQFLITACRQQASLPHVISFRGGGGKRGCRPEGGGCLGRSLCVSQMIKQEYPSNSFCRGNSRDIAGVVLLKEPNCSVGGTESTAEGTIIRAN
ncbi:hypothetical protein PR048_007926 [Dryococelus australis]|uniref:Uncharacterized protein n=1 Tax=Dryococelus australis TaxID=614101 RepID=A0ABQ9HVN3_9NEOP|nr:hypothetical protein PR048_007926 [Dryococelus australis]